MKLTLENATPARAAWRFLISLRIEAMPACSSAGSRALTNNPRPATAACQRSSTPVTPGRKTVGDGVVQLVVPAVIWSSVFFTLSDDSTPSVPSDSAAKLRCCHFAGSFSVAGTLFSATDLSNDGGRRSFSQ
ncbi:MAG: hypothetical protein IPF73_18775 [Betaproteobacteria bacterium]|nr:hypothetical protein [Betaproteobacteria bacterium]